MTFNGNELDTLTGNKGNEHEMWGVAPGLSCFCFLSLIVY